MHVLCSSPRLVSIALSAAALMMVSCAQSIQLTPRDAAVPAGADLTGSWRLQDGSRSAHRRIERANGGLVHVFIETGTSLKTTQTEDGLFISFDRSVVEEYRFGENREVRVGPVAAQRVSGWDGQRYVIETMDEDSMVLREAYWLAAGGDALNRRVVIEKREQELFSEIVAFDRIED